MSAPQLLTTGEQTVTATGAVTGSLSTASMAAGVGSIKLRVTGLTSGQSVRLVVEDTNNATPFSDALQVWTVDTAQGQSPDGNVYSVALITLPDLRIGSANTKLRVNCQAITSNTSIKVLAWVDGV